MTGPLDTLKEWINEKSARSITDEQYQVDQGNYYGGSYVATGTVDKGQINLFVHNPNGADGVHAHMGFEAVAGGRAFIHGYENVTLIHSGTHVQPGNLNRNSNNNSEWQTYKNVGVDSLGDKILTKFVPGSAAANPNAARAAGAQDDRVKWQMNPKYGYLMVLFNDSGATVPLELGFEWGEHD